MDTTNAPSGDDDLSIDWGVAEDVVDAPAPELALTLPPDLFGPPEPDPVAERPAGPPAEDPSAFVLNDLFRDAPEQAAPQEPAVGAPLVVEDLLAPTPAVAVPPEPRPRLAPERPGPARHRRPRPKLDGRKLLLPAAVVAAVVALSTLLNQPPDPSVDVRSAAAAPDPAPTVPASTRPLPTTTAAPTSTTAATAPSTTAGAAGPTATAATTAAPAVTAAPRATVTPTPVTTAAPPPPPPAPTSAPTTVPEPVVTEPPPDDDTTETTRRPRQTVPPPTTAPPTTATTVEPEELVEVD
ncbi:MAG TPA: hypothetical protein VHF27_12620 [Acidimicrobiales bacterium]|nr:hypothetical protein [Acidimicrobiales bacterium]